MIRNLTIAALFTFTYPLETMLTRTLLFISLLCCVTLFAEDDSSLEQEAARFHREAWLLYGSGSYDFALERAETAYALKPENQEYKETVVQFLNDLARFLLVGNLDYPGSLKENITSEDVARSLVLMHRAFDLVENDAQYLNRFNDTWRTDVGRCDAMFGTYNVCLLWRYCRLLASAVNDTHPELKKDADKFMNRVFADWIEYRYPNFCEQVVDARSFIRWKSNASLPQYVREHAPASVRAACDEAYNHDLSAFQKKYPAVGQRNPSEGADEIQSFAAEHLSGRNKETADTQIPWKEEIQLFESENVACVRLDDGNTLCVLKRKGDTFTPILLDLETFQRIELASWTSPPHLDNSNSASYWTDWRLFCGQKYVALGTNDAGIVVFPRDGDESFVIDLDTGLPGNHVQGIGLLDSTIYAGVGDAGVSWLVKIDLPSQRVEILSSSRGREGKTPFFDLLRGPQFHCFVYDAKRDRLLFQVFIGGTDPLEGLWVVDGKSGEIARLAIQGEHSQSNFLGYGEGEILADGDTYLAGSSFRSRSSRCSGSSREYYLIDLREETLTQIATTRYFSVPDPNRKEFDGYIRQCTVQDGWMWGIMKTDSQEEYYFGRVRVGQPAAREKLDSSITTGRFVATPDGNGLIRVEREKIVLMRL